MCHWQALPCQLKGFLLEVDIAALGSQRQFVCAQLSHLIGLAGTITMDEVFSEEAGAPRDHNMQAMHAADLHAMGEGIKDARGSLLLQQADEMDTEEGAEMFAFDREGGQLPAQDNWTQDVRHEQYGDSWSHEMRKQAALQEVAGQGSFSSHAISC